jgi:hypothetical protein
VWIDTEKGEEAKHHLRNMVNLNMMEEFHVLKMEEHRHAAYFAIQCEMDHEEYKEKREERVRKHEKVRCAKEAYARGGETMMLEIGGGKVVQITEYAIKCVFELPCEGGDTPLPSDDI